MGGESTGIGGGDGIDGGSGGDQPLGRALGGGPEALLDLGEGQLDRVEVRGVGRQAQETRPHRRHGLPGSFALVRTEIVQNHDLPGAQTGSQDAFGGGGDGRPVAVPQRAAFFTTQRRYRNRFQNSTERTVSQTPPFPRTSPCPIP